MPKAEYENDKFIVINKKVFKELDILCDTKGSVANQLFNISPSVSFFRELRLFKLFYEACATKKLDQTYYVCNQDEPYAQKVIDTILQGESEKI